MNRKRRRILAKILPTAQSPIPIEDGEMHHIRKVLRVQEGEPIEVIDGKGHLVLASVEKLSGGHLGLVWMQDLEWSPQFTQLPLILECAWIKPSSLSWLIEKAVELDVMEIHFFRSQHLGFKLTREREIAMMKKLNKIALQSLKQCKRLKELTITNHESLPNLLDSQSEGTRFFGSIQERDPGSLLIQHLEHHPIEPLRFVVGPEGGFAPAEERILKDSGAIPTSFGQNVLRAETAAIYCATLGQAFLTQRHPQFILGKK